MEFEYIMDYIIQFLPIVLAIFGEILVVVSSIAKITSHLNKANKTIESAQEEVNKLQENAEYRKLKNQMQVVLEDNATLKKQIAVLMEKLTTVRVVSVKECKDERHHKKV